jgi:PiT family inorganic phosphate transporter
MFKLDRYTRNGLLLAGIFGSYSLGANNIANVMGVFVPVSPFSDITFLGLFTLSAAQQLFFLGGLAIALGVFTYSKRVMMTVGSGIMELSPVAAFVAVWSHSIVLFLFSSQGLETFLRSHGLPAVPLVPVSSSQAIVGAVIGMGLLKGGKSIKWPTVGGIASGWVITPIISAVVSFICLFFMQNVFLQETYRPVQYKITPEAELRIENKGIQINSLTSLLGKKYSSAVKIKKALSQNNELTSKILKLVLDSSEIKEIKILPEKIDSIDAQWITKEQIKAIEQFVGQEYTHKWQFSDALASVSLSWRMHENEKKFNKDLEHKLSYLHNYFKK